MLSRRRFLLGFAGAGMAGGCAGVLGRSTPFPDALVVRTSRIAGPPGGRGKRIAFVSDVHFGPWFGERDAAALGRIVRSLRPDLAVLGGDLAETPDTPLGGFFAHWSPGCPTVYSPGNHDMGCGPGGNAVAAQASASGCAVLSNAAEDWNGVRLVGFPSALRAQCREDLLSAPGLKVLVAHEPDTWASRTARDLVQLSGHTHGGQVRILGRPLCRPTLGRDYTLGEFERGGNSRLIVSAGIGCTEHPVRYNCPPEIVVLEFV